MISTATVVSISMMVKAEGRVAAECPRPIVRAPHRGRGNPAATSLLEAGDVIAIGGSGGSALLVEGGAGDVILRAEAAVRSARPQHVGCGGDGLLAVRSDQVALRVAAAGIVGCDAHPQLHVRER